MKYLLAAIDIDGTLSNSNKELSGYTVSTIIKAQKRGLKIVIASGRPTHGLAYYADLLQIYDYGGDDGEGENKGKGYGKGSRGSYYYV